MNSPLPASVSKNILVVDDDPGIRETLSALLEDEGYAVTAAVSGSEAVAFLARKAFDLVITDIRMPRGDGMELLADIRNSNPNVPVVFMMSGFSDFAPADMVALGAKAFFHKPFDVEELLNEIESLV